MLDIPKEYTLGEGHVKFFYDKLLFLYNRYNALEIECILRGFNVSNIFPKDMQKYWAVWNDYTPSVSEIKLSYDRIKERMPSNARYTSYV
jgi:hypothetical protein